MPYTVNVRDGIQFDILTGLPTDAPIVVFDNDALTARLDEIQTSSSIQASYNYIGGGAGSGAFDVNGNPISQNTQRVDDPIAQIEQSFYDQSVFTFFPNRKEVYFTLDADAVFKYNGSKADDLGWEFKPSSGNLGIATEVDSLKLNSIEPGFYRFD